jgi:phosphonate transport system permease protein
VRARAGALVLDAALPGYVLWCVARLAGGESAPARLLREHPWLAACGLPLALLGQVSDASPGQRLAGIVRVTPDGARAPLDRRALAGVVAALEVGLLLLPVLLLGASAAAAGLSLLLAVLLGFTWSCDPAQRSFAERAAGLATVAAKAPPTAPPPWWRRPLAWVGLLVLGLTLAVGAQVTRLDVPALFEGAERTGGMWRELLSPDWSITPRVIEGMVETVFIALMASLLALPFAFVLGFLAARNVVASGAGGEALYGAVRALLNVARSMEPLVWAIIFSLWVGVGPFAGMLALGVHSVASLAKLYSEALEGVDPGPVEAIRSTGARTLSVLRWGMLPQVIPAFLSFTVYRWDINVRMATILGLVGGGGIGGMLLDAQQLGAWRKVGTIVVFITLVVWVMDVLSSKARRRVG